MGIGDTFGMAFNRAQLGAGITLPRKGTIFISVNERGKEVILPIAARLAALGFRMVATRGTAEVLRQAGKRVDR